MLQNKVTRLAGIVCLGALLAVWTGAAFASVDLNSFTTQSNNNSISVRWQTGNELDNLGFHIWRNTVENQSTAVQITGNLIPSAVSGQPIGADYDWEDQDVQAGVTYYYWLQDLDTQGTFQFHGPVPGALSSGGSGLNTPDGGSGGGVPTSIPAPSTTPQPSNTPQGNATTAPTNTPPSTNTPPPSSTPSTSGSDNPAPSSQSTATPTQTATATILESSEQTEADDDGTGTTNGDSSGLLAQTTTPDANAADPGDSENAPSDEERAAGDAGQAIAAATTGEGSPTPMPIGSNQGDDEGSSGSEDAVNSNDGGGEMPSGIIWAGLALGALVLIGGGVGLITLSRKAG